jgi:hypothetical protein
MLIEQQYLAYYEDGHIPLQALFPTFGIAIAPMPTG